MVKRKIKEKEKTFIDSHYKGVSTSKMVELLYKETGTKVGKTTIVDYYKKMGYQSGVNGEFQKGYVGLSEETKNKIKLTQFKNNHVPPNKLPTGTSTIRSDGYKWIKVKDGWKCEHNIVWEKAYGKIPKGYRVLHLDRNRLNNNIDNLILMSDSENVTINGLGLTYDPDINKAILLTTRIKQKVKRHENN